MIQGVGKNGAAAATQAVNSPLTGPGTAGGELNNQKDAKESSTEAKFGDVWKQIQTKYGAKPEKPREIKKTMGKDDFLRIMITQMKHQDPSSPFKAEQFATEMAQFTSVEQMQNMNSSLNKMANQNQPLERLAMTNLIGKTVTVDRERFPHTEGTNDSISFALPKDASQVRVAIVAESGETILEKDLGALKTGDNSFSWDGLKSNSLPSKTGNYSFRIEAKDGNGQAIQTNSQSKTRIVGVSFEGAEAVFLTGNSAHPDKITMRNIVRIESDGPSIPGVQSLADASAAAAAPAPQKGPNFIAFQKGQGSANLDPNSLPPEAQEALARYAQMQAQGPGAPAAQAQAQAQAQIQAEAQTRAPAPQQAKPAHLGEVGVENNAHLQQAAHAPDLEKGFPNGLHQ